jgi:hypothetical protein
MTAKSKTNGKVKAVKDKYNTPAGRAKSLKELESFHQLYPSNVIEMMYSTIIEHVSDKLQEAGMKAESELIGNDLFTLRWLADAYANGTPTEEKAYEIMQFFGLHGLHESVAKVVKIMAEDDGGWDLDKLAEANK